MNNKYLEQFERVKRWYKRFEEINLGTQENRSSDDYEDIVYAFFMNCYHLGDWIINSTSLKENDINIFVSSHKEMQICRSLCFGSKHLIDKKTPFGRQPEIARQDISLRIGGDQPVETAMTFWVRVNDSDYNAFETATKCLRLWEEFLKEKQLLS